MNVLLLSDDPLGGRSLGAELRALQPQWEIQIMTPAALKESHVALSALDAVLIDVARDDVGALATRLEQVRRAMDGALVVACSSAGEWLRRERVAEYADDFVMRPIDGRQLAFRLKVAIARRQRWLPQMKSDSRYALASRASIHALWEWDLREGAMYLSPGWLSQLDFASTRDAADDAYWFGRVHADDLLALQRAFTAHFTGRAAHMECEYRIRGSDGRMHWMLCRGTAEFDADGNPLRIAGVQIDVTRHRLQDRLTGLWNERAFDDEIDEWTAAMPSGVCGSVFLVDLLSFHLINVLGRDVGDRVLIELARRISQWAGPTCTVARVRGARFSVINPNLIEQSDLASALSELQRELSQPIADGPHVLRPGYRLAATQVRGGQPSASIVRNEVEYALEMAKSRGHSWFVFSNAERGEYPEFLRMTEDMEVADLSRHLLLHYQPIVELAAGTVVGFEALVRWKTKNGAIIGPDRFVPIAEETGAIHALGEWVLDEAISQLAAWEMKAPASSPGLRVSVNVSPHQLVTGRLPQLIRETLERYHVDGESLAIEITETGLFDASDEVISCLEEISAMGVEIHLDDFGTGYSSLEALRSAPVDVIKIDRAFIWDSMQSQRGRQLVEGVVAFTRSVGLVNTAEGVEDVGHVHFLTELGCSFAQGYYFARPLSASDATEIIGRSMTLIRDVERAFEPVDRDHG